MNTTDAFWTPNTWMDVKHTERIIRYNDNKYRYHDINDITSQPVALQTAAHLSGSG